MRHAPKAAVMLRTCINAKIRKNLCIAVREKRNLTEVNRTGASMAAGQKHKSILAEGKTGIEICSEFSLKNLNSHRPISLSLSLLSVFLLFRQRKMPKNRLICSGQTGQIVHVILPKATSCSVIRSLLACKMLSFAASVLPFQSQKQNNILYYKYLH